jgi:hypothetical protein
MAKTKQLPKKLFVKVEHDGTASYFVADDAIYGMVEMGETVKIGTYELVETTFAKAVVETSRPVKK